MEILIFIAGFVLGAGLVFAIFALTQRKAEDAKEELISRMQLQFENLTNKIFKESSQEFSEQNKAKLEEFFSKFRQRIEDFEKRTEFNFKTEAEKLTQFDSNVKTFIEAGNKISQDTTSLATMMKGDNRRQGSWGEIVLERVLEASGLREGQEYELQKGMTDGRPDATINLPEGKKVYIDAKTSLASWDAYVNSEDETEKEENLKEFLESTKAHITGLSKRPYSLSDSSPDYVLMFIPIESCYSLLFCEDSKLWDLAWKNNVMPVSPSTLLAALKIINNFYKIEKQNKNALEISRICTKMLDKFADMLKDVLDARKKISSALTRLNGHDSIIRNIEKLQELGTTINKQIPEIGDDVLEEIS
ncbi:MAG TPA: DNA recombination protein RmuC [Candidatus Gastranaerophilaceae bacterium]|nr:DNA recombination protein RmuC [Candidatus Gastranaerophilaceae bacterium]HPT40853.1 DNA recombination protein RmuC [Candidatus Gastranaerophilaceae bacterium]